MGYGQLKLRIQRNVGPVSEVDTLVPLAYQLCRVRVGLPVSLADILPLSMADILHLITANALECWRPEGWRADAGREFERWSLDAWFRGALSAVTRGYRWTEVRPGGAGAGGPLLTAEESAVSLRTWPGVGGAAGLAVDVVVLPYVLSEDWARRDCRPVQCVGAATPLEWRSSLEPVSGVRAALLRFVVGVLVSLRLMLVRVLLVLSRLACAVAFVLVLVAARLRCGCPSEPDECAFLLSRRFQTWSGSAPAVS